MKAVEAYNKCRDHWSLGVVKTCDDFADFIGLSNVDEQVKTQRINQRRTRINRMAARRVTNWRIRVNVWGESVVKLEDTPLVNSDVPAKLKRISEAMDCARTAFDELQRIEGLESQDKRLLKGCSDTLGGGNMMFRGAIQSMHGIDKEIKQELLEYFNPDGNDS